MRWISSHCSTPSSTSPPGKDSEVFLSWGIYEKTAVLEKKDYKVLKNFQKDAGRQVAALWFLFKFLRTCINENRPSKRKVIFQRLIHLFKQVMHSSSVYYNYGLVFWLYVCLSTYVLYMNVVSIVLELRQ